MSMRAVAVFPRFKEIELIEEFRARFDPAASTVAAHITLLFPIDWGLDPRILHLHVQNVARKTCAFSVELKGISPQNGGYLFLNVSEGKRELAELYEQLHSGYFTKYKMINKDYLPHMTIGRFTEFSELKAAAELATQVSGPYRFTVDSIFIMHIRSPEPDVIEYIAELNRDQDPT